MTPTEKEITPIFKKGDVVQLKSGGQHMTIDNFVWNKAKDCYYTDKVECVWFDGKKNKKVAFHTTSLTLINAQQ